MSGELFYNHAAGPPRPARRASMKDGFALLFPPPRTVRLGAGSVDCRSVCFPLEIFKKYDFLFGHFFRRNRSRGLQVVIQERPFRSPAKGPGLAGEEYAIDCGPDRVELSAVSGRGQFYALSTLLQILALHGDAGRLPVFSLRDSPALDFRGARISGVTAPSALPGLLLSLALLKINCLALPAAAGIDPHALAAMGQRMGIDILFLDADPSSLARFAPLGMAARPPAPPLSIPEATAETAVGPEAWFDFFMGQCRSTGGAGGRTAAWGDWFLHHHEWIRRIPRDVLVLNRGTDPGPGRGDFFTAAVLPFKEHHVRQVLCPTLCERGRFLPDARAALSRVDAAFALARAGKLMGIMLGAGAGEGDSCLPQGAALALFQAGCQLWSGRLPGPGAFSHWALGRDEPDLFRVYSFLAQAEHRLPQPHNRYLFEDPQLAPFSSQGDPREVEAHFRKAALYLQKREFPAGDLSEFLDFVRCLYGFIADKVEFSRRLGRLGGAGGAGEGLQARALQLERSGAELKESYLGLWRRQHAAADPLEAGRGFDFVSRRLRDFSGSAQDPAAGGFPPAQAD
jgi:hypothetical protein